jgi:hypothetical protein
VAHELSEVMGRNLEDNTLFIGGHPSVTPLDLFHYSAPNTRSFAPGGYFSFDNGATQLDPFNSLTDGSDPGDWAPGAGNDAFLNQSGSGVYNNISITDLRLLDVIGWDSTGDGYGADTNFAGLVRVNGATTGNLNSPADHDWIRVRLTAGSHYAITVSGQDTGGGTNADPAMHIYDSNSVLLISSDNSSGHDPHLPFTPLTTGFYYVDIYSPVGDTGSYTLGVTGVIDAAPSDFYGDGHSGILWQNTDGTPAIWSMNGTSLNFGSNVGFDPGPAWHEIGAGDFNGDGKADILWQNDDGTPAVWLMNGATILSGANVGFNPGPAWHEIAAADFNGDGKADILWQNADGTPAIWLMDGLNVSSGANVGFNPGPAWHVVGAGDFNGDGKADILWQNDDGQAAVWLMNGLNLLSGSNVGPNPGPAWHVVGVGDFNGDGKPTSCGRTPTARPRSG